MGVGTMKIEKKLLGGAKAVNNFMFKGKTLESKNLKIDSKRKDLENEIAEELAMKEEEKKRIEENKLLELAKKNGYKEEEAEEVVKSSRRAGTIFSLFNKNKTTEKVEVKDKHVTMFIKENDGKIYEVKSLPIDFSRLRNDKFEAFDKAPNGVSLLKRDLKASLLYVEDEGDLLKVNRIVEVEAEVSNPEKAFLLLETNFEDYVIDFDVKRSF